ncbi:RBBP9/YdeN family alpha/beta hydrolase [Acinetobacter lanii]|uniref:Serine hydrolase family protein n=1 Tax=Acinetobacter lanii TaxID=2715163 RepID=A0A6G8S1L1_9GAMM|nr:YqiA/YcfP family alpha/beta fold hydrolase [Acinetobacter lanii]QIO08096.1 serine hydrolase family protein [Acinetobacter lanii]
MAQVNVIHGYTASPEENWFPWLQAQADQHGIELNVLRLDPSERPQLQVWDQQIQQQLGALNEDSVLIAHSLGCLATLHYLSHALQQQRIRKLILVAGFNGRLGRLEQVNPFIDAAVIDFELLKQQITERVVIYSEGDARVLPKFSLEQAHRLNAKVIAAQHQGHFIDSEGCTELPEVWQEIISVIPPTE